MFLFLNDFGNRGLGFLLTKLLYSFIQNGTVANFSLPGSPFMEDTLRHVLILLETV